MHAEQDRQTHLPCLSFRQTPRDSTRQLRSSRQCHLSKLTSSTLELCRTDLLTQVGCCFVVLSGSSFVDCTSPSVAVAIAKLKDGQHKLACMRSAETREQRMRMFTFGSTSFLEPSLQSFRFERSRVRRGRGKVAKCAWLIYGHTPAMAQRQAI